MTARKMPGRYSEQALGAIQPGVGGEVDRRSLVLGMGAAALLPLSSQSVQAAASPGGSLGRVAALLDLTGKVAVVTDSGFKASMEVAQLLADAGARIVIADVEAERTQALAGKISAAGAQAVAIPTDIEEERSVVDLFKQVDDKFGRTDILVNCAGLTSTQPLTQTTIEQWDRLNSLNLRATFLCMREAVKAMVAAGNGGRIVNVTTIGALHPVLHGNEAYSSSRAAVTMLTKTTALDYARSGIRANVLMPGAIPGKVRYLREGVARSPGPIDGPQRLPLGFGTMDDVAAAVLFLVSPASAYMSGQTLVLDGAFLVT